MLWFLMGALIGACMGVVAMGICRFSALPDESLDGGPVRRRRQRSLRARRVRLQSRFIA